MSVNSITGAAAAFPSQPLRETRLIDGKPSDQTAKSSAEQPLDAGVTITNASDRHMNYVLREYDLQGELNVKFMDSFNNVIYQFPDDVAAKINNLMDRPGTSTNTKV